MDFSFTLINIKAKFNISTNTYDLLITFVVSIVCRIILFFLMCLIYPLIKNLLYRWICKKFANKSTSNALLSNTN